VRACRQNNSTFPLAAFGPLTAAPSGFQKGLARLLLRAAPDAIFWDENLFRLSAGIDVRKELKRARGITGSAHPAASWWATTKAPDEGAWYAAAVPQLQAAAQVSPYVMVYREGTITPEQLATLGRTVRAVRGP
jgi:hypothetical protein